MSVSEFKEFLPNRASEDSISVRDDSSWQSMQLVHIVHIGLGNLQGSKRVGQSHEMSIFAKLVDDHQNNILFV